MPKLAATLQLIREILERKEQVVFIELRRTCGGNDRHPAETRRKEISSGASHSLVYATREQIEQLSTVKTMKTNLFLRAALALLSMSLARHSSVANGVVGEATESDFRAALAGGGTVTFAVSGTIALSDTVLIANDTTIDGTGQAVTISGENLVRVFQINTNVQFALLNLTVANGRTNQGAGLYNAGGSVLVSNCVFSGNSVIGASQQPGYGGAAYNTGSLTLIGCGINGNSASGDPAATSALAGTAFGGGIFCAGTLVMTNCTCLGNAASGVAGAGNAYGGAICKQGGQLSAIGVGFGNNWAFAAAYVGPKAPVYRGAAQGGAIYNTGGSLLLLSLTASNNTASGSPAAGGAIYHGSGSLVFSNALVNANTAYGDRRTTYYDSVGSDGNGGGVYSGGTATVSDCTFSSNSVSGGDGVSAGTSYRGNGGNAQGGGLCSLGTANFFRCTFAGNSAVGGKGARNANAGGHGGAAYGAGLYSSGGGAINCTFVANRATGGLADEVSGAGGSAYGGGYCGVGTSGVTNCTFFTNVAIARPGADGPTHGANGVSHGNLSALGTVNLVSTILAAGSSNNAAGSLSDLGHNISSDASVALSAAGSRTKTDPLLGPLGNYGGLTLTMPLSPGSPALDATGNTSAPATDQRGRTRPYGSASDIGAFESSPPYVVVGRFIGFNPSDTSDITLDALETNLISGGSFRFDGLAAGTHFMTASNATLVVTPSTRTLALGPDVFDADFTTYHSVSIDTPPQSQAVFAGSNVTLTVTASGDFPNYQWRFNGTNLAGATTSSLTLTNFQPPNVGPYVVVVSNVAGAVTSSPPAVLSIAAPPVFLTQPQSQTNFAGNTVVFRTTVSGTAPLYFQWRKGATPLTDDARISGSTSSNLTIANLASSDAGNYSAVASNALGTATSSNAVLTVFLGLAQVLGSALPWTVGGNIPWFTETTITHDGFAAAQSGAIADGQSSSLSASVMGPGTVTFWWKVSSEEAADYLQFFIGATAKVKISGEVDWQQKSFAVPAGPQVLEWRYMKDADVASDSDAGWLDEVRFENNLLDTLAWNTNSGFQFRLDGLPPGTYVVLGSSNLTDWLPISTNVVSSNSPAIFADPLSRNLPLRFYRAQQQ